MKRLVPIALASLVFAACQDSSGPAPDVRPATPGVVAAARGVPIPGSYIITFSRDVQDVDVIARALAAMNNGRLTHVYGAALKGFAIDNLPAAAAALLARDPRIVRVEEDELMTISESSMSWGLDRIDQRSLPLDGSDTFTPDAKDVTAYIIDTGINFGHVDFGGRATAGIDEVTAGGTAADCNGHGTHVSGTVAGSTYGIAKSAKLVAVRVLDCSGSGSTSGVIAGINWVAANRVKPAVANMSLGGGLSATLNAAVKGAVDAGVTFAVAAGNSTANACNSSPSSEPSAITVGATDRTDTFASFSNYGSCVDINAPGVNIVSDWMGSTTATNTISGTSMASPHVAGAAALYLAGHPDAMPPEVTAALVSNATSGALKSVPAGTVNALLYTGSGAAPPPPPPPPTPAGPVAAIASQSCSARTCTFKAATDSRITSYSWNFGDNTSGSGSSVSHRFARATRTYVVTLTIQPGGSSKTTQVACTSASNGTTCK